MRRVLNLLLLMYVRIQQLTRPTIIFLCDLSQPLTVPVLLLFLRFAILNETAGPRQQGDLPLKARTIFAILFGNEHIVIEHADAHLVDLAFDIALLSLVHKIVVCVLEFRIRAGCLDEFEALCQPPGPHSPAELATGAGTAVGGAAEEPALLAVHSRYPIQLDLTLLAQIANSLIIRHLPKHIRGLYGCKCRRRVVDDLSCRNWKGALKGIQNRRILQILLILTVASLG